MKTRLLLIAVLSAMSFALHAQIADSTKNSNEILFNGHRIRIYKTAATGYGYDIFYQNSLVIHQENNPFTGSPGGLKNKDDAIRIAKWQTMHLNPANPLMATGNKTVPIEVARQLSIPVN